MSEQSPAVEVRHNPDAHRYEGYVDGALAGFAAYTESDSMIAFDHTEVDGALRVAGSGRRSPGSPWTTCEPRASDT